MKIRVYINIIIIWLFISCNSQTKQSEKVITEPTETEIEADSIMNFPRGGRIWIALKTTDQNKIAKTIGLETYELTNWRTGFEKSRRSNQIASRTFITPVINNKWTLVTGYDLPFLLDRNFNDFVNELSTIFGDFSYYYIYKDTAGLVKAKDGKLERFVYYNNNSNITEKGDKTKAEKDTPLTGYLEQYRFSEKLTKSYTDGPLKFKATHKDIEYSVDVMGDVYERYSIPWPNLDYISHIAEQWSINPRTFIENGDTSEGLGFIGKTNYKY